jgi:thiol-disulfide isomerase/thioredoxin
LERSIDSKREIKDRIKYKNVVKLNGETLNATIAENDFVFVEFYIPTCQHCVSYASEYEKVATHFENIGSNVVIAAMDSSDESEIAYRFDIWTYPTFKVFIKGDVVEYDGKREPQAMIDFNTQISQALMLVSPSIEIIPRPFVAIRGICAKCSLNSLPALFASAPVYHVTDQKSFSIEFYG